MSHSSQRDTELTLLRRRARNEQALLAFVTEELLAGREVSIDVDTPLFEDRLIDSINILKLIGYIESKRGHRLDEKDIVMPKFRTVRAMVESFFDE